MLLLCAAGAHDGRGVFCHVMQEGSAAAGARTCCTMTRVARCCTLQCESMGLVYYCVLKAKHAVASAARAWHGMGEQKTG